MTISRAQRPAVHSLTLLKRCSAENPAHPFSFGNTCPEVSLLTCFSSTEGGVVLVYGEHCVRKKQAAAMPISTKEERYLAKEVSYCCGYLHVCFSCVKEKDNSI